MQKHHQLFKPLHSHASLIEKEKFPLSSCDSPECDYNKSFVVAVILINNVSSMSETENICKTCFYFIRDFFIFKFSFASAKILDLSFHSATYSKTSFLLIEFSGFGFVKIFQLSSGNKGKLRKSDAKKYMYIRCTFT